MQHSFTSNFRETGFYTRTEQKTPFCEELRSFLASSRENQTLFANLEGSIERRTVDVENSAILDQFICSTLFADTDGCAADLPSENLSLVKRISNKIICLSSSYSMDRKLYFSSVFVYFFEYKTKKTTSVPLFKIFKREKGKEAVFLDVNLVLYNNWIEFIDTAKFPVSFLCVPRNGEYCFVNDKLDLEFFNSRILIRNVSLNPFSGCFKPYFLFVRSRISKTQGAIAGKLKKIATYLHDLWKKEGVPFCKGLIYLFIVISEKYLEMQPETAITSAANHVLMLFHKFWQTSVSALVDPKSQSQIVGRTSTQTLEVWREDWNSLKNFTICKNWHEAMKIIHKMFKRSIPIIQTLLELISGLFPFNRLLAFLLAVLPLFEQHDAVSIENKCLPHAQSSSCSPICSDSSELPFVNEEPQSCLNLLKAVSAKVVERSIDQKLSGESA